MPNGGSLVPDRPRKKGRGRSDDEDRQGGFALVAVLLLLAALYVGATGIFMAARAELRIGISHTASSQAFHIAQAGLATWVNSSVQPALATYSIGGTTVDVMATRLLAVDSVTTLYRVVARATVGGTDERNPGLATRQTSLVARRSGAGPVVAVTGTWRENF